MREFDESGKVRVVGVGRRGAWLLLVTYAIALAACAIREDLHGRPQPVDKAVSISWSWPVGAAPAVEKWRCTPTE